MRRTQGRRRTSAEWAELVSEWQQSGLSAEAFATQRRLKASTLSWWKWKLETQQRGSPKAPERSGPRLLPVEVVESEFDGEVGWELRTAAGHVLRVHGALTDAQLEEILGAMMVDEAAP